MARVTVAQLAELVAELRAEVDALRLQLEHLSTVRDGTPPRPLSEPIDFEQLAEHRSVIFSKYVDDDDTWGPHRYL